jgi:hypothetical protein
LDIIDRVVAAAQNPVTATPQLWAGWLGELRKMQRHVLRREWELVLLEIDPPATKAELRRIEIRHGLTMPAQLRELLLLHSAHVHFGWSIPILLQPLEGLNLPTSGGLHDSLWSLEHIDQQAIPPSSGCATVSPTSATARSPTRPRCGTTSFHSPRSAKATP